MCLMIDQQTVWDEVWPVVQELIRATLDEDSSSIRKLLAPNKQASQLVDLFGPAVLDISLKTVLGRERLGLARAIETEGGRFVHIEYAWPDPRAADNSYTAADVVSVQLKRYGGSWRVVTINPASTDTPMSEARAQGILVANQAFEGQQEPPSEPWILPVALFAGALQLPLREQAMQDEVENLLLPGLQQRTYGVLSIVAGRRLWRDFLKKIRPNLEKPAVWAAASEFIMSEQGLRDVSQAAVGQYYSIGLSKMLPSLRTMKQALNIKGLDERYSPFGTERIVLDKGSRE